MKFRKLGILFLLIGAAAFLPHDSLAYTPKKYIVAVKQINPSSESHAVICEENDTACRLDLKITSAKISDLRVDILIASGNACFKFRNSKEHWEGNGQRHFCIPVGPKRSHKDVYLYRPWPDEYYSVNESLVLRRSNSWPIAHLAITIMPKTIDY